MAESHLTRRLFGAMVPGGRDATGRISAGTEEGNGKVSGESLKTGPPREAQEEQNRLVGGPFKLRPSRRLHSARAGDTLSAGPGAHID